MRRWSAPAGALLGMCIALTPALALAQNGPGGGSGSTSGSSGSGTSGSSGSGTSGSSGSGTSGGSGSGTSGGSDSGTSGSSGSTRGSSGGGTSGGSGSGTSGSSGSGTSGSSGSTSGSSGSTSGSSGGSGSSGTSGGSGSGSGGSGSGSGPNAADFSGSNGGGQGSDDASSGGRHRRVAARAAEAVDPAELTAGGLSTGSAPVQTSSGGSVLAGNLGVSLPAGALASVAGASATVNVSVQPVSNLQAPGGAARFSPNGTLADVAVTTGAGQPLTTFAAPITLTFKYNAADLAMAGGDPARLTVAFVIDASSPDIENPLHFPVGSFVAAPASNVSLDAAAGVLRVRTQALGSVVAVVTNPVAYVQTLEPQTPLYSSFDPAKSTVFGTKSQFAYLQLVEPQVGSRFLTIDPTTGGYAYVDAAKVGASSPPPTVTAGVVRGLRRF